MERRLYQVSGGEFLGVAPGANLVFSDRNLEANAVKAFKRFHHFYRLPDTLNRGRDSQSALGPAVWCQVYGTLLLALRAFGDIGALQSRYDAHLDLDVSLRELQMSIAHFRSKTTDRARLDALQRLDDETLLTIRSLRHGAVTALLGTLRTIPRSGIPKEAHSADYEKLVADHLHIRPTLIIGVLAEPLMRYAAIALLHDYADLWLNDKNGTLLQSQEFTQVKAAVIAALDAWVDESMTFDLASGLLAKVLRFPSWRAAIMEKETIGRYLVRARTLFEESSSFWRLQTLLAISESCNDHPGSPNGQMKQLIVLSIARIPFVTVPFLPPALEGYLADINSFPDLRLQVEGREETVCHVPSWANYSPWKVHAGVQPRHSQPIEPVEDLAQEDTSDNRRVSIVRIRDLPASTLTRGEDDQAPPSEDEKASPVSPSTHPDLARRPASPTHTAFPPILRLGRHALEADPAVPGSIPTFPIARPLQQDAADGDDVDPLRNTVAMV